jgi:hypothetical protein
MDDVISEIEEAVAEAWEETLPREDLLVAASAVMARLGLPANIPEMAEDFLDALNAALREQSESSERVKYNELTQLLQGRQRKLLDGSLNGEARDSTQIAIELALYCAFWGPRIDAVDEAHVAPLWQSAACDAVKMCSGSEKRHDHSISP